MSVDLLFTFYAWAARPAHENAVEASAFESRINNVMQAEKNQGMCAPRSASEPSLLAVVVGRLCSAAVFHCF